MSQPRKLIRPSQDGAGAAAVRPPSPKHTRRSQRVLTAGPQASSKVRTESDRRTSSKLEGQNMFRPPALKRARRSRRVPTAGPQANSKVRMCSDRRLATSTSVPTAGIQANSKVRTCDDSRLPSKLEGQKMCRPPPPKQTRRSECVPTAAPPKQTRRSECVPTAGPQAKSKSRTCYDRQPPSKLEGRNVFRPQVPQANSKVRTCSDRQPPSKLEGQDVFRPLAPKRTRTCPDRRHVRELKGHNAFRQVQKPKPYRPRGGLEYEASVRVRPSSGPWGAPTPTQRSECISSAVCGLPHQFSSVGQTLGQPNIPSKVKMKRGKARAALRMHFDLRRDPGGPQGHPEGQWCKVHAWM